MLDITRARIKLTKAKYQNRARVVIVLVRLDIDGPPHTNPDGVEAACLHMHIYRAGYGAKWAMPLPADRYTNTLDLFATFATFMERCNISLPPKFNVGLF